jgi:hypothetical protein
MLCCQVTPADEEPCCEVLSIVRSACGLARIASVVQGRAVVDGKDHVLIPCFTNMHLETSGVPLDDLEPALTEALDESWRCGVTTTVVFADDDVAARRIQVASSRLATSISGSTALSPCCATVRRSSRD